MLFLIYLFFSIEGGTNVDNWTFEGLIQVVTEFTQYYAPQKTEEDKQDSAAAQDGAQ